MTSQRSGELKKKAWLAKQRLKMGYWDSVKNDSAVGAVSDRSKLRVRLTQNTESPSALAEEKMYRKVCDILDRDETTMNPIGQLIDGEVYDRLDSSGRQRYILELSNKFRELKERYYRERTGA